MNEQSCCAHRRIDYAPVATGPLGTFQDGWKCQGCAASFVPEALVAARITVLGCQLDEVKAKAVENLAFFDDAEKKLAVMSEDCHTLARSNRELRQINVQEGISLGTAHEWKRERDALKGEVAELQSKLKEFTTPMTCGHCCAALDEYEADCSVCMLLKERDTARDQVEELEFQVAELDFGAGGVLSSLQYRKEENERQHQDYDRLLARHRILRDEVAALQKAVLLAKRFARRVASAKRDEGQFCYDEMGQSVGSIAEGKRAFWDQCDIIDAARAEAKL